MPNNKSIYTCLYKHLSPFTAYKKGCRCQRCLLNKRKSGRLSSKKQRQNPVKKLKQYEYNKQWFKRNKHKKQKYDKTYREKHLDKIKKHKKKYYLKNKNKIIKKIKRWIKKNQLKEKLYKRKWSQNNKHVLNALNTKRRVKIQRNKKSLTQLEQKQIIEIYKKCRMLTEKTGIVHHVDHIIPISKNGKHHPSNLQILTAEKNLKKGANLL